MEKIRSRAKEVLCVLINLREAKGGVFFWQDAGNFGRCHFSQIGRNGFKLKKSC